MNRPLNFGVFVTPFHPTGESPRVALEYDMDRVVARAIAEHVCEHQSQSR